MTTTRPISTVFIIITLISVVLAGFTIAPAVVDGAAPPGTDKNVYALNANNGTKLWHFATGASVYSSPEVANGVVYVGSDDGNLYALNATTGAELWNHLIGGGSSSPAVANGVVYEVRNRVALCRCGASSNKLFCDGGHMVVRFTDGDSSLENR